MRRSSPPKTIKEIMMRGSRGYAEALNAYFLKGPESFIRIIIPIKTGLGSANRHRLKRRILEVFKKFKKEENGAMLIMARSQALRFKREKLEDECLRLLSVLKILH